jgi:tetratricopeptide (TPR) repeat protein
VYYTLKHLSIRVWATIFLGGLISLWILSVFHPYIGLEWSLVPALVIMIVIFMAVGWFSNRFGLSAIKRMIREATTWERVGAYRGAEEAFKKATAVLDSYLLSPFVKRKESAKLAARLARFYLARTDKNHFSGTFIVAYLKSHPEDEEVAENWLQQVESHGGLKTDHYELAFRIGNAQPNNSIIQQLLARFYLAEGRTDFTALQMYRQVLNGEKNATVDIIKELATLFLRDRRADEWALKIYLEAFKLGSERHKLLRGIAACVHWIHETERSTHLLQKARKLLVSLDEMQLKKLRAGFNPPIVETAEKQTSAQLNFGIALWKMVSQAGSFLFNFIISTGFGLIARARDVINLIKQSRRPKLILKWTMITTLAIGVIVLTVNTTSHLIRTKKARYEKEKATEIVITDPFTLQVAAYLKPQDAERYVKYLKSKQLDVFLIKRRGKNRVWYQVRVSHFASKESAREYGKRLKLKGIIDDFYVANFERP